MHTSWLKNLAIAALGFSGAAFAAPFASVPSTVSPGQNLALTGGGFVPGAVITLKISVSSGRKAESVAVLVQPDGTISYSLPARDEGTYLIRLLDFEGRATTYDLKAVCSR